MHVLITQLDDESEATILRDGHESRAFVLALDFYRQHIPDDDDGLELRLSRMQGMPPAVHVPTNAGWLWHGDGKARACRIRIYPNVPVLPHGG